MDFIKYIHFDDPDKLLNFLEIEDDIWNDTYDRVRGSSEDKGLWVFRGQALSSWGLHNKLAREIIKNKYTDNLLSEYYLAEIDLLEEFISNASSTGLELPLAQNEYKNMNYIGLDAKLNVSALAQHYGLPTRLLDWTFNPFVALYFALSPFEHLKYSRTEDMAIWCLNRKAIGAIKLQYSVGEREYIFSDYYSIFHANKNRTPQQGLFTYIADNTFDNELEGDTTRSIIAFADRFKIDIEEIDISKVFKYAKEEGPMSQEGHRYYTRNMFFKITISRRHFKYLMRKLENRFINHHSLFPDYQGCSNDSYNNWLLQIRKSYLGSYKWDKQHKNIYNE